MENKKSSVLQVNFVELLLLLFLGLKLAGKIDWDWIWVFSPLWIPAVAVVVAFGVAFLWAVFTAQSRKADKNDKKSKK